MLRSHPKERRMGKREGESSMKRRHPLFTKGPYDASRHRLPVWVSFYRAFPGSMVTISDRLPIEMKQSPDDNPCRLQNAMRRTDERR